MEHISMILKKFTVYDSKAEAYLTPFYTPSTGLAIRSFGVAANQEGHDFYKFGADFTLFELGEFDDKTALETPLAAPINLGTAITFIEQLPLPRTPEPKAWPPTPSNLRDAVAGGE